MIRLNFSSLRNIAVLAACITLGSCKKDKNGTEGGEVSQEKDFHLAYYVTGDDAEATYIQGLSDLSKGEVSFNNFGFRLPATVTTRFYSSTDGKYVYALDYPAGLIAKYEYKGGQNYTKIGSDLNASIPLGVTALRMTKLDDNFASLHAVGATAGPTQLSESVLTMKPDTAQIGIVNLQTLRMDSYDQKVVMDLGQELRNKGYRIFRIDAPVVSNGKAFFGCGLQRYNLTTGAIDRNAAIEVAATLVVDYPSLKNATVMTTAHVQGSTNGYRTPMAFKNEAGEIYQLVSSGTKVFIAKIKNGQYDPSFTFDLQAKNAGVKASNGWFYVGNGIGYVPYNKNSSGEWGVVRININTQSVVDLTVPAGLDLRDYQYSVAKDDKFYMALSPKSGTGNIYIFDINSEASTGFTIGSKITTAANQYYIGIF